MNHESKPNADAKFAWREVGKIEPAKRSATERVSDFFEIYSFLDEETARRQALRCIQCPEPTCVQGCPLNNRIPEWLGLVAEGRFKEASQVLSATSCMEEIYSRLCSHPCEPACILEGQAEPVAINAIERFLHEYGFTHGVMDVTPAPRNGRTVAVMNAGPCGLTCAFDLIRQGYQVTVYDHRQTPGGLLVSGIPSFKMEKSLLERRLALLKKLGANFQLGVKPGVDPSLAQLLAAHDAVFFGAAVGQVKPLDVPGSRGRGVHQGLTFIVQKNVGAPIETDPIEVKDRRVVVLGGGDVAMDCLRTALRLGAAGVTCVYRRAEAHLPANPFEYRNAREEGARFEFQQAPVAILRDPNGEVTHVRCVQTRAGAKEPDGRPLPEMIPGSENDLPADVVLVAMGFVTAPFEASGDLSRIALTPDGRIVVDANLMTCVPGVFAGGTLVRGQSAFLDAVRDARAAARAIHQYLEAKAHPGATPEALAAAPGRARQP